MGRKGEEREGRGRDGKAGHPNILLHPQIQFSSNMPKLCRLATSNSTHEVMAALCIEWDF